MFNRKGVIDYDSEVVSEDDYGSCFRAGADDIVNEDGIISVYTAPENFETVLESLQEKL